MYKSEILYKYFRISYLYMIIIRMVVVKYFLINWYDYIWYYWEILLESPLISLWIT